MLRIVNEQNGRQTDYSRAQLAREARHAVKMAKDSDNVVRGWYVHVSEHAPLGARVALVVDYLTWTGEARSTTVAI